MKTRILTLLFLSGCASAMAQRTIYLDKNARFTENAATAIERAVVTSLPDTKLDSVAFYSTDGSLKRISHYATFAEVPEKRVLHGMTTYKFKGTEQDSMKCFYRNNLRQGSAIYYYPDGKEKVRCSFKEGLIHGLLLESFPDGKIRRKDIYEKGVATGSNIYSEEGELLGNSPYYVSPTPEIGLQGLMDSLSYAVKMPNNLWTKEGDWKIYIEASFDETGNIKELSCVQTNYEPLIKPVLEQISGIFHSMTFAPATMDKQPVVGSIVFPLKYKVRLVNPNKQKDEKEEAAIEEVDIPKVELLTEPQKIWLDANSERTYNQEEAVEYVVITYEDLEKVRVEFYNLQDVLKERTYYQNFSWKNRDMGRNGTSTIFYSNGQDSLVCNYRNNKRVGKYISYYPNGQINLNREVEANGRTKRLKQYYPDGSLKRVEEPGQEKLYYDEHGTQILPYIPFEQKASMILPGKMFAMLLAKELKYPAEAQKLGISGKVVMQLLINKEGKAIKIWVARSLHPLLDQEALRVMNKLVKDIEFNPAYVDGQPMEGIITYPLTFRLGKGRVVSREYIGTRRYRQ